MLSTQEYKYHALRHAQLIIDAIEIRNPNVELEATFSSGSSKYLEIREKRFGNAILTFQGSTYYDLFRAVQSAWHTHMAINCNYE